MENIKFVSLADGVFEQIESDILSGKYKKGELLTEVGLSKQLSVSRTPVREAIRRLEQENLVKETPKGHIVTGISEEDIVDIYDIRLKLEGVATAKCVSIISDEGINKLNEIIELQDFYTAKGEADKIKTADSDFHSLIYSNCGSPIYESILSTLHRKIQLYRKISVSDSLRAEAAVKEHKEIYDAILAKKATLAEALAVKHINNARINIMRLK